MPQQPSAVTLVSKLVERFEMHREAYLGGRYNETQLRREFIDPLWKALGWDIDNEQGYAEAYKDVIHEDAIKVSADAYTKAPDYCFRIGGVRKYFLEAKKPSVDIEDDPAPAFQLRRYAWSAKLPLSILTDFEHLAVYDTRVKPASTDKASKARTLLIPYTEYVDRWDEIESIFSRDAVLKGSFDKYAESTKAKRGTAAVDEAFLQEIESWRDELARNLARWRWRRHGWWGATSTGPSANARRAAARCRDALRPRVRGARALRGRAGGPGIPRPTRRHRDVGATAVRRARGSASTPGYGPRGARARVARLAEQPGSARTTRAMSYSRLPVLLAVALPALAAAACQDPTASGPYAVRTDTLEIWALNGTPVALATMLSLTGTTGVAPDVVRYDGVSQFDLAFDVDADGNVLCSRPGRSGSTRRTPWASGGTLAPSRAWPTHPPAATWSIRC